MFIEKLINGVKETKEIFKEDYKLYYADGWKVVNKPIEKPSKKKSYDLSKDEKFSID